MCCKFNFYLPYFLVLYFSMFCYVLSCFVVHYFYVDRKCPIEDLPTYNLLDEKDYVINRCCTIHYTVYI